MPRTETPKNDPVWPGSDWERSDPGAPGIDAERLGTAIAGTVARESDGPRDTSSHLAGILSFQTHRAIVGPFRSGSGPSGVVVHCGYVVGEWGDPSS